MPNCSAKSFRDISNSTRIGGEMCRYMVPTRLILAKDFVKKLLVTDPAERLTAKQALRHPFITREYAQIPTQPLYRIPEPLKSITSRLKNITVYFLLILGSVQYSKRQTAIFKADYPAQNRYPRNKRWNQEFCYFESAGTRTKCPICNEGQKACFVVPREFSW